MQKVELIPILAVELTPMFEKVGLMPIFGVGLTQAPR